MENGKSDASKTEKLIRCGRGRGVCDSVGVTAVLVMSLRPRTYGLFIFIF